MPEFSDNFTQKSDNWFDWEIQAPLLRDARVRYDLNPDCCSILKVDEDNDIISVVALCEVENGIVSTHKNAWDFILSNTECVEKELRRKLWPMCLDNYHTFAEYVDPSDEAWQQIQGNEEWTNEKSLDTQIELIGINLLDRGFDEIGFSLFDFAVGWDEEHGVSILMHRNRVLAASGLGDFTNRGENLIAHARSIQAYNFTAGDLKLDE